MLLFSMLLTLSMVKGLILRTFIIGTDHFYLFRLVQAFLLILITHLNAGPTSKLFHVWMVAVDNVSEVMSGAVILLFDSKLEIVGVKTLASSFFKFYEKPSREFSFKNCYSYHFCSHVLSSAAQVGICIMEAEPSIENGTLAHRGVGYFK